MVVHPAAPLQRRAHAEFAARLSTATMPGFIPGHSGWAADGSDWGEQYLDNFYKNMTTKHADKIAVGAAWPGFDDSHASWGLNRHMDARCGKTFEQTLGLLSPLLQRLEAAAISADRNLERLRGGYRR